MIILDELVKSQKVAFPAIPAKAGIQFFPPVINSLLSEGCTHVAMESTGVYWKRIFNI